MVSIVSGDTLDPSPWPLCFHLSNRKSARGTKKMDRASCYSAPLLVSSLSLFSLLGSSYIPVGP